MAKTAEYIEAEALLDWLSGDPDMDEGVLINMVAEKHGISAERLRELVNETVEGT